MSNTAQEIKRGAQKTRVGKVISDSMDKTIIVESERTFRHPLYAKVIRKSSKFYAHDEKNECKKGDVVKIAGTRRLSKLKRWRLVEVITKSAE